MLVCTDGLPNRSNSDTDTIDMISKICHDVFLRTVLLRLVLFLMVGAVLLAFNLLFTSCQPSSTKCRFIDFFTGAPATMSVRAREPALTQDFRTSFPMLTAIFRNCPEQITK